MIGSDERVETARSEAFLSFLAVGRGTDRASAEGASGRAFLDLWTLLVTTFDYAEVKPIEDRGFLEHVASFLALPHALEFRRRLDRVRVGHGVLEPPTSGLGFVPAEDLVGGVTMPDLSIEHLFPWVPSDDTWRRMLEALTMEPGQAAFVVHVRGCREAPSAAEEAALRSMASGERIARGLLEPAERVQTVLASTAGALRNETLARLSILRGGVLAARSFLFTTLPASSGLVATVLCSVDDASVRTDQAGAEQLFRGGAHIEPVGPEEVLKPMIDPGLDLLFGPREATAMWRTPMPSDLDLPGIPVNRARTATLAGKSGHDCALGINVHRDSHQAVAMDEAARFRHTYVVGQTGTGKSTLLLHMILHDIRMGRGVAVLDPHGSLVEDVLVRFPASRIDDVILVDVSDVERPVAFNLLHIEEADPLRYRIARDFLIDDLYSYMDRVYDMKATGGPMFEAHFRGMLALLLGLDRQEAPLVPNLMIFRALYTNKKLRDELRKKLAGRDLVIDEFLTEAVAVGGEASLANIAPYVTSKFNRFVTDASLRNITCQRCALDLDGIVNDNKVLLFYLGKGRFGDLAAGLLASQVVSRIRHAVMKRGTSKNLAPFFLYADEFQLFADDRFGELLAEARKFGLSLTVAHQYARQVPEKILQAVLGNVGTVVSFRVGPPDAELPRASLRTALQSAGPHLPTELPSLRPVVRRPRADAVQSGDPADARAGRRRPRRNGTETISGKVRAGSCGRRRGDPGDVRRLFRSDTHGGAGRPSDRDVVSIHVFGRRSGALAFTTHCRTFSASVREGTETTYLRGLPHGAQDFFAP